MLISIIVTLYNTPVKYFERCVKSLSANIPTGVEIIVVDDGSDESQSRHYEKICESHQYIDFYKQVNQGVSAARNYGISVSKGKYIGFVDGDDTVTTVFYQEACALIGKYQPDVAIGRIKRIPNKGRDRIKKNSTIVIQKERIDALKKNLFNIEEGVIPYQVTGTACGRLFKADLVKNNEFHPDVTHYEDQIFNWEIIEKIKSAVVVTNVWYYYYMNDFSAMHEGLKTDYIKKQDPFFKYWFRLWANESDIKMKKNIGKNILFYYYAVVHNYYCLSNEAFEEKLKDMKSLLEQKMYASVIQQLSIKDFMRYYDKIRFLLMKRKCVLMIYFFVKAKNTLKEWIIQ